MKKTYKRLLIVMCGVVLVIFVGCGKTKEKDYYSEESNYVEVVGTVIHMAYYEDEMALYLGFSELNPKCEDVNFKIVGKNLAIAQENGIEQKIKLGDTIKFVTAPKCFGDGYVMPIVAVSVDGEVLLEFEEGFENFLEHLKK